ncbi:MAG: hypothetical protein AAGK66_05360 [Pseudomonadota bacterium]
MFRLYKRDKENELRAYYEVWAEPARRRIIEHWGVVGEAGETETHRIWFFGGLEKQFEKIMAPARAQGFEEIALGDYETLIVMFTDQDDVPTPQESASVADRINEILGWTGLGFCHSDEVSGKDIDLTCRVIDAGLARGLIQTETADDDLLSQYSLRFTD